MLLKDKSMVLASKGNIVLKKDDMKTYARILFYEMDNKPQSNGKCFTCNQF